MNKRYLKKICDIVLYLLLAFVLAIILVRALPYPWIQGWHLPFVKFEPFLYAAVVLFVMGRALDDSAKPERYFIAPLDGSETVRPLYRKADYWICGVMFLLNIVYLMAIYNKNVPNFDEGFILTLSDRVLRGEVPHKDFFLLMTPGAVYFNAWMFRLFGETVLVERTVTLLLASFAASVFYLLARRGVGYFFSVGATLLFTVWQFPMWFQANYSWYAVSSALIAFWVLSLTLMRGRKSLKIFLLLGFVSGVTFLFKQNTGLFTLIAVALYSPMERVLFSAGKGNPISGCPSPGKIEPGSLAAHSREMLALLLGFAIPFGVCLYVYVSHGYGWEYLKDVSVIPWQNRNAIARPYVELSRFTDRRIMAYMPPFVIVLTAGFFARKIRGHSLEPRDRFALLLSLAAIFSFLTVFPRADSVHIIFALWPSLALVAYWIQRSAAMASKSGEVASGSISGSRLFNSRSRGLAIVFLSSFILMLLLIHRAQKNVEFDKDLERIDCRKGKRIYGEGKSVRELNEVIQFFRMYPRAGRSEPIFSTNPLMYFLTSRPNATSCDYVIDGNVRSDFENELMAAIDNERPCLVLLDGKLRTHQLMRSWESIENNINQQYTIAFVSSGGRYRILERNNEFSREIKKLEGLSSDENVEFRVIRNYDSEKKRGRIILSGDARDAVILCKARPRAEFPVKISPASTLYLAVGQSAQDVKTLKVTVDNSDEFSADAKPYESWQSFVHTCSGGNTGQPREITCVVELLDPEEGDYVPVALPSVLHPRKNGDFNVVIFSCDALRADHLGIYGYARDTAPNLSRLAQSSWTFSNAISQSSWTTPSFAALLTSMYPSENGAHREHYSDKLDDRESAWWDRSGREIVNLGCVNNDYGSSLPEVLRRTGYFTKAYTFIELFSNYAVNQNFGGSFDSLEIAHQADMDIDGKTITTQMRLERVKSFLEQYSSYKFFLFFHVKEPHTDYAPPESFARKYIDPSYAGPIGLRIKQSRLFSEKYGEDDNRRIVDLYDAQINCADDILGQLIETLKSLGMYENTVLVFMSDHGEEFASDPLDPHKGRFVHGHSLRYHLIHVPLVMRLPGLGAGTIAGQPVQLIDVAPTLYDFLGIHVKPGHITGQSLLPLISGGSNKFRGYAISERVSWGTEEQSVLEGGYQYIRTLGVPYEELYSLNPNDPNVNLAESFPQLVAERRARLDAVLPPEGKKPESEAVKTPAGATSRTLTKEAEENLRSLGYLR